MQTHPDTDREEFNTQHQYPSYRSRGRTINLIVGGFATGSELNEAHEIHSTRSSTIIQSTEKPHTREEMLISFSDEDVAHVVALHDNALTIKDKI